MNIKAKIVKQIDHSDWNELIEKTYGKPYNLQQQDGCKSQNTMESFSIPDEYGDEYDYENDKIEEMLHTDNRGVSFAAWLERDPKQPLGDETEQVYIDMWWGRNFYPSLQTIADDLHKRGLLDAGKYTIHIHW